MNDLQWILLLVVTNCIVLILQGHGHLPSILSENISDTSGFGIVPASSSSSSSGGGGGADDDDDDDILDEDGPLPGCELAYEQSYGFFTDIRNEDWRLKQEHHRRIFPNHQRSLTEFSNRNTSFGKPDELGRSRLWYGQNFHVEFVCPHALRVPSKTGEMDGPKFICDPHRIVGSPTRRRSRRQSSTSSSASSTTSTTQRDESSSESTTTTTTKANKSNNSNSNNNNNSNRKTKQKEKGDCLVYSVGCNANAMFERGIHDDVSPDCEVHTFDLFDGHRRRNSALKFADALGNYSTFHHWGIGSPDAVASQKGGRPRKTLRQTVVDLGHEGRTIDILKIDCEWCEWFTFQSWFESDNKTKNVVGGKGDAAAAADGGGANENDMLDIRQILVETHNAPMPNAERFFYHLHDLGYVIFSKEANFPNGAGCVEYGFLKLKTAFFVGDTMYRKISPPRQLKNN